MSLRRCIAVVFTSRRRSIISQRCSNVPKKTSITRRLRKVVLLFQKNNVVILLLKRCCNYDVKTTFVMLLLKQSIKDVRATGYIVDRMTNVI